MTNVIVVGAQWGDEGKAKVIDLLAEKADVVIRCQGGCNAGHTVVHAGEVFKFHHLPSGLLYKGKTCIIGPGTVIHPEVLAKELASITERGYSTDTLKISDRAHITLPYHVLQDQVQEKALADKKIGTTGRGIGPTYMDKVGRLGLRVADLLDDEANLICRLETVLAMKAPLFASWGEGIELPTLASLLNTCRQYADILRPFVVDTIPLVRQAIQQGKHVLFEGAQGTLLDVDFGTYPFVTSSNASSGGACTGSGVGPTRIDDAYGVMKAYTTRVGEGPFPTELTDEAGKHLLNVGNEYGTTTGRARRCGWFDGVVARYSVQVNGLTGLAITKLDVLSGLPEIKLCTGYRHEKTGDITQEFPARVTDLAKMSPVYETFPGWTEDISACKAYSELPQAAQVYLNRVSELLEVPLVIVSVGPDRHETIVLHDGLSSMQTEKKHFIENDKVANVL